MNFLDAYDITEPTETPRTTEGPETSLNEEVTQVVGQLSRFWGGFRKQVSSFDPTFSIGAKAFAVLRAAYSTVFAEPNCS